MKPEVQEIQKPFNNKERKVQVTDMFRMDQLQFIQKKIDPKIEHRKSRASILQFLVDKAMINPSILD